MSQIPDLPQAIGAFEAVRRAPSRVQLTRLEPKLAG